MPHRFLQSTNLKMTKDKVVFVTVGTTKFDNLINSVLNEEFLDTLKKLGYNKLVLQTGRGNLTHKTHHPGLEISSNRYFENFQDRLEQADLIISHAGAGTCLEILRKGKPAIVVINEELMDNHQIELAQKLQDDGYIYYCNCLDLKVCILKDVGLLKKYPKNNIGIFPGYLNKCMGFI